VVGEVLGRALRELDLPSQRLLAALALVGADTPRAVLASALDLPLGDLQRCVEETLAAGILVAQPPAPPRFRHDLLADSAIDLLGRDGERELQRRLAASWDGVPSSAATRARAAASLVAAVPLVDADEAVAAAQRAASVLAATGDHATAARLLGAAAEALSIHGLNVPSATSAVLVDLGEARAALGDSRGAEEAFEAAAASKPTDVEVRARAECGAARHINLFADDPARRRRLAEADDALPPGDHPIRAALLGRRAVAAMARTDLLPEASRLADEAVIMARRLGDLTVLATATIDRHLITTTGTDLERADNEADELSRLGETSGRADLVLVADQWRYATCVSRGDLRAARAVLDRYEVLASLMPSPEWRYTALLRRSTQSLLDGDRDNALGFLDEAVPLGREALPEGEACGLEHALRTLTVRLTGVPDPSLAELHAEFEDHVRNIPVAFFQVHLACSDLALGRTNAATKIVDRWAADPSNLGGGRQRPALLATLGALVADLALTNHASDMRRALEAFSGLYIPEPGFGVDLPVDDALGRLALLDGDVDVAIVYLERALSVAIALPSPVVEARCRQHLGDAYIAAGDAARGDAARREAALLADRVGILLPGAVVPAESRPPSPAARLRRAGKTWVISAPHGAAEVLHSAGMDQLAKILAAAPQEVAAVELARPGIPVAADLGSIIDATAKRAYRRRITELRADIDEADADNDVERAARARVELDTLMDQLRQAVGIGGRDRPNRSGTERARINVARAVRRAINSISQALPELGAHLQTSIRTGRFCSYRPEPATALDWTVEY
jgi:tetratricopeptide (TPR) repeat protein